MPAPVRAGEMSTRNSRSTISVATPTTSDVVMLREDAAERAGALGSLERVEPGAEADVVLEALAPPTRDHANERVGHRRR